MKIIKILESSIFDESGGHVELFVDGELKSEELVNVVREGLPFKYTFLNPVQTVFYRYYSSGNALVSSSTSSGKTLVALLFSMRNRERGRFIYTAPTRSLIREKFKEFRPFFSSVGIRTGELIEELDEVVQPAVVCTYESLLSAARNRAKWFEEAGAVVIDEVHVIRDPLRGAGIEEIVSYCLEEGIPLLALSATIPGALDLAKWMEAELLIESEWRPVPLERKVFNMSKLLRKVKLTGSSPEEKVVALLEHLKPSGKTIVFVPRKDLGWQALRVENALYGKRVVNETLPFGVEEKEGEKVAFHNADVPQAEREAIEDEFKEGDLNRLYATQTLAYGVNLPADSVVILVRGSFDRFTYRYRFFPDLLTVLQMEGRAGRFGLSEKGYSYIVVTGAKEDALEKALEEELNMPFETALSSGIENRNAVSCPNRRKSFLSLMVLGPLIRYGKSWREAVTSMFSLKKNPLLIKEVEEIVSELEALGFIDSGKPTPLTRILVSSFVSPFCFLEFTERLERVRGALGDERTLLYSFVVRPLLRKEFYPSAVALFAGEGFYREAKKISSFLEEVTGIKVKDNSEVLAFYASGGFFPCKNVARPPGELSTLPTESSLLAQLLCKLNVFDFETVHRIAMMVRSGIPYEFSLLGSIEGLGYMRGNALALAGKLMKFHSEVPLINAIREGDAYTLEALKEALSYRYESLSSLEREFNAIVKIVEKIKFPLGNLKLLRFLASLFVGRRKALELSKEEALEVLFESVRGQEENEGKDRWEATGG
ncbi:DEAD/DEAH box helicase [Phorcysia thermohydrogeniphila]|uniref:Helicase n=1 Tax=Phorcysia thermohydrogeniphila TaxID=936138 RepID=A0A4R1G9V2_9BACT|nr:DEAD/DEAH box helicase [Phorcysia thermohydrogeniphila]TCK03443.1 helicase [Phorcysia thermohydrogeniphila]